MAGSPLLQGDQVSIFDDLTTIQQIGMLREAAAVKRWHTARTHREQTLAEHSYGVAVLAQQLDPQCRKEVILAALWHDLPEYITGDTPAHAKRRAPQLAVVLEEMERACAPLYQDFNLTVYEEHLLKYCDLMELIMWSLEEVMLGNTYALDPAKKGVEWLQETINSWKGMGPGHTAAATLLDQVATIVRNK